VTSSYFDALKIPLLRERFFTPADLRYGNWMDKGAVRIIDEALAKRLWPDGDPLGAEIGNDGKWATIVGVVGSVHDQDLATEPNGMIYVPGYGGTTLVLRTASDPIQLAETVRQQIRGDRQKRACLRSKNS
jgi:MacB-like periplasmic core domain